jgi:hypothetical protein
MKILPPPANDLVVYDSDPDRLVAKILQILDDKYKDINDQLKYHDHHWFLRETSTNPPPHAG